jgi:hypothetical protein
MVAPDAAATVVAPAPVVRVAKVPAPPRAPASHPTLPRSEQHATAPASSASDGARSSGASGSFGAEGPAAVRSLARAFTRAIAPANHADAAWSKLSPGDAGSIKVTITLDDDGHLALTSLPANASPLLEGLVKRTVALLRGGSYAVRGPSASLTITLSARALDVDVAKIEGGNVELGWTFESGVGHASFLRDGGRRVDVTVRVSS